VHAIFKLCSTAEQMPALVGNILEICSQFYNSDQFFTKKGKYAGKVFSKKIGIRKLPTIN
jgi:hypothetical protein